MTNTARHLSSGERARRERQSAQATEQGADPLTASLAADEATPATPERMPTPEEVALAQQFFEQSAAQNLDEVAPEPVSVTIREYVERSEHGTDGQSIVRRRLVVRSAQIETFVPMKAFNRMMAGRRNAFAKRALLARAGALPDEDTEPEDDPVLVWMQQNVLQVWQLTEPEMTLERLTLGLSFQQIQGLFARFFGEMLRQSGSSLNAAARGHDA